MNRRAIHLHSLLLIIFLGTLLLPIPAARAAEADQSGDNISYVLYEPGAKGDATQEGYITPIIEAIHSYYGKAEQVVSIPVENAASFTAAWAQMDEGIHCVVFFGHGNPQSLCGISVGGGTVAALKNKTVDTVVLLSCNAGHLSYRFNIAQDFAAKPGINRVVAADGTVYDGGLGAYITSGDSVWREAFYSSSANVTANFGYELSDGGLQSLGPDRTAAGWVCYQGGLRVRLFPQGQVRQTVATLLRQAGTFEAGAYTQRRSLSLQIGRPFLEWDSKSTSLDAVPILLGGEPMIPLRAVVEALGGSVCCNPASDGAVVSYQGSELELPWYQSYMLCDHLRVDLGAGTTLRQGRTLVSLRFAALVLGGDVRYTPSSGEISLDFYSPKKNSNK